MHNQNLITWIGLISLTGTSYLFSESQLSVSRVVLLVSAITAIKFMAVGFQFMDVKHAHLLWKIGFAFLLLLYLSLLLILH